MSKSQTECPIPNQRKSDERKTIRPESPREQGAPGNMTPKPQPQER